MNLLCPSATADKLGALCLPPCVTVQHPIQARMAGMGRVPRAAEREGSSGAARRCPWLRCQGRGSSSWHLLSPCREARTAPARPGSKWLLCPCAANGEPAEHNGQGKGAASQEGPPASLQPWRESHPSLPVLDLSHVPPGGCLLSLPVSPVSCRVRLCQGGRSMEEQPEEPSC